LLDSAVLRLSVSPAGAEKVGNAAGLAGVITFAHAFRSPERLREVLCAGNSFRSSTGEDARRSIAKHTEMVSL